MGGGASLEWLEKTPKKKFMFMLKSLREQIKRENDELKKSTKTSTAPTGKMKYLGGK